jgi:hypothetical protein
MDRIMVVASIWSMCALCAVLFVRGASTHTTRREKPTERTQQKTRAAR